MDSVLIVAGVGIDIMTGLAIKWLPEAWLFPGLVFRSVLALAGFSPKIAKMFVHQKYRSEGKKMGPLLVMGVGAFLFIAGIVWYYIENPPTALEASTTSLKPGKGGSGTISGGGGIIVGGHGGELGGDGGGGTITGGSGIITGGDAGGADGPGRGGRSPLERLEELGLGSDSTRFALLYSKLGLEYVATHGGTAPNPLPEN